MFLTPRARLLSLATLPRDGRVLFPHRLLASVLGGIQAGGFSQSPDSVPLGLAANREVPLEESIIALFQEAYPRRQDLLGVRPTEFVPCRGHSLFQDRLALLDHAVTGRSWVSIAQTIQLHGLASAEDLRTAGSCRLSDGSSVSCARTGELLFAPASASSAERWDSLEATLAASLVVLP